LKTICLLLTAQDKVWAEKFADCVAADGEIVFVAPTFEGVLVARELGIDCQTCEEIAWSLNKTNVHDDARKMAREWFELDELKNNINLKEINAFGGYPLLLMHQSLLVLSLMEVLEAWRYMNRIVNKFQPNRIICGSRSHPFAADKDRLYAITGSAGLELEAVRIIATQPGIEFIEMPTSTHRRNFFSRALVKRILKGGLRRTLRLVKKITCGLRFANFRKPISLASAGQGKEFSRVLANCYGGYYLDQIKDSLMEVTDGGISVVVNIIGGDVTKGQIKDFSMVGIQMINKSHAALPIAIRIRERMACHQLKRITRRAMTDIKTSPALSEYFSDEFGSFCLLALAAIRRELIDGIPLTAASLVRTEAIITMCSPDMVVSQFDLHPSESCDVLPARKQGIPTLGMDHGVCGLRNTSRHTFASEYLTVSGNAYTEAMGRVYKSFEHNIFPVGDLRIDMMGSKKTPNNAKASFGLDPERPVCIFCDNSGWRMTNEWRNSELKHVTEILRMKEARPELQLIYRVHHGADYRALQHYIESSNIKDVIFQVSPDPQFADIVQAADVVVTHFSSSIAEALTCGVPVIYLCALSEVEPACLGYEAITVVQDFDLLGEAVDAIIEKGLSREEVRLIARDYIDRNLCGNDGLAAHRLAQKIVELAKMPKLTSNKGFESWVQRVDESSYVRMTDLLQ